MSQMGKGGGRREEKRGEEKRREEKEEVRTKWVPLFAALRY